MPSPLRLIAREGRTFSRAYVFRLPFSFPSLSYDLDTRSRASIFWEIVQLSNIQAASHGHCNRHAVNARTLAPLRDLGVHLTFLL